MAQKSQEIRSSTLPLFIARMFKNRRSSLFLNDGDSLEFHMYLLHVLVCFLSIEAVLFETELLLRTQDFASMIREMETRVC